MTIDKTRRLRVLKAMTTKRKDENQTPDPKHQRIAELKTQLAEAEATIQEAGCPRLTRTARCDTLRSPHVHDGLAVPQVFAAPSGVFV